MALITCSECGKQISDKASTCPGCRCSLKAATVSDISTTKSDIDISCPYCNFESTITNDIGKLHGKHGTCPSCKSKIIFDVSDNILSVKKVSDLISDKSNKYSKIYIMLAVAVLFVLLIIIFTKNTSSVFYKLKTVASSSASSQIEVLLSGKSAELGIQISSVNVTKDIGNCKLFNASTTNGSSIQGFVRFKDGTIDQSFYPNLYIIDDNRSPNNAIQNICMSGYIGN